MALIKIKLGDYIERYSERCNIPNLTVFDVSGINREKEFFEPSKQVSQDTSNYKIVPPGYFACNLMHIGRDVVLPVAINRTKKNKYVSPAYTIFYLKNEDVILSEYLFIFLNSSEKDRYFWFHCDSSVRDGMDWSAFSDIELEIPPKPIQEKYVAIYKSLLANLHSYEKGLDDLKLVCDGYIENLRKNMKSVEIANYIVERNIKNENSRIKYAIGISMNGIFESERTAKKDSIAGCKIVRKNNILWASQTTCGIGLGAVGMYEGDDDAICAPTCTIIDTKNGLNPHYLLLWLRRKEFWRYSRFVGSGVVEKFDSVLMGQVKIPIPDGNTQLEIVNVYKTLENRKKFISALKLKIQNICPVLIRGSVLEANGGK